MYVAPSYLDRIETKLNTSLHERLSRIDSHLPAYRGAVDETIITLILNGNRGNGIDVPLGRYEYIQSMKEYNDSDSLTMEVSEEMFKSVKRVEKCLKEGSNVEIDAYAIEAANFLMLRKEDELKLYQTLFKQGTRSDLKSLDDLNSLLHGICPGRGPLSKDVRISVTQVCPLDKLKHIQTKGLLDKETLGIRLDNIRQLENPPFSLTSKEIVTRNTLTLYWRAIRNASMIVLSEAIGNGALPNLKNLIFATSYLQRNTIGVKIGDAGMIALSEAIGKGGLPALNYLSLFNNKIGDAGMIALSEAIGKGALPRLEKLNLYDNKIGDVGLSAFAKAVGSGALPALTTLNLGDNQIADRGMAAFAEALSNGALPALEELPLGFNQIGDAGVLALSRAIGNGALPSLYWLSLENNQISNAGLESFASAISSGGLPALKELYVKTVAHLHFVPYY